MLNLNAPIIYTAQEQTHVSTVLKPQSSEGWKDQKKKTQMLKNRISTHTIIAQGGRCAYCESLLIRGAHAIEHIAPKGLYGEFCYESYNLVTACSSCNSNKGEYNTLHTPINKDYTINKFKIVHPYFDIPDDHFKYVDKEKTVFDMPNCTEEAKETINMFHWNESWAYSNRVIISKTKDVPIDVLKLVAEIATYRP